MTNPNKRHIIFVIDRSGSIRSILSDMQGGFEQYVTEQQEVPLETTASLYQFDDRHDELFSFVPLAELKGYKIKPRGMTRLLDALGTAITREGEKLAALPEDERPGTVLAVVSTDGLENDSREYTRPQVAAMTAEQQEKYGWVFVYNGANQDAFAESGSMGVAAAAVMDFDATPEGTRSSWDSASKMSTRGAASGNYAYTDEERAAARK